MKWAEQIVETRNGLLVRAPAKINLSLLVAGKRPDGFHELETVMAKVDLFDEILIRPAETPGIELLCEGPQWAPEGPDNLVCRAARMLLEACGVSANLKITLTKNIPAGSGLGSASSDAAATLKALKHLLQLDADADLLNRIAERLGSDVPFFLDGPIAYCTGRGEKMRPLSQKPEFEALLVLPNVSVSTKKVYDNYRHDHNLYRKLSSEINDNISYNRIDSVAQMCANMLQESCFRLNPHLAALKAWLDALGLGPFCLSGSGSAMFNIFNHEKLALMGGVTDNLDKRVDCRYTFVRGNGW